MATPINILGNTRAASLALPVVNAITSVSATQLGGNQLQVDLTLGSLDAIGINSTVVIGGCVGAAFLNGSNLVIASIAGNIVTGVIASAHASYGPAADSGTATVVISASGLPDGHYYAFLVRLDLDGNVIGRSLEMAFDVAGGNAVIVYLPSAAAAMDNNAVWRIYFGGELRNEDSYVEVSGPLATPLAADIVVSNIDDVAADQGVISCPEPNPLPRPPGKAWQWEHDGGTPGTSCGNSSIVSSPSHSGGTARRFDYSFSGSGGERFHIYLGTGDLDFNSTSFVYDTWVYINDLTHINQVEFDCNQVDGSGQTYIFGVEADFVAGFWKVTSNSGGSHWNITSVPVSRWSSAAWHHLVFKYHRDNSGNITYDSVALDGVESVIGMTLFSRFSLGWSPNGTLLLNFQVNGDAGPNSGFAVLDELTLRRNTYVSTPAANSSAIVLDAATAIAGKISDLIPEIASPYYSGLITSLYQNSPKFLRWLNSATSIIAGAADAISAIDYSLDIDNAIGSQLDLIGAIIGASRQLPFQPIGPGSGNIQTMTILKQGSGYHVGEVYAIAGGNNDARIKVTVVGGFGALLAFTIVSPGTGYGILFQTPVVGSPGSGATVSVSAVSGIPSATLVDEDYRILLKAKIAQNQWDGQLSSIFTIWQQLFPGGVIIVLDNQNMTATVFLAGAFSDTIVAMITNGLIVPRPEGVLYTYTFSPLPAFGFNGDHHFIGGFDEGHFV